MNIKQPIFVFSLMAFIMVIGGFGLMAVTLGARFAGGCAPFAD